MVQPEENDAAIVTDTEDGVVGAEGEQEGEEEAEEMRELPMPLQNLVILPPRQKDGSSSSASVDTMPQPPGILHLPPLQLEEPVQSIRMALAEVIGYAHFTSYRLEIEEPPVVAAATDKQQKQQQQQQQQQKPKSTTTSAASASSSLASPYTGPDAVVCVPFHFKSLDQHPGQPVSDDSSNVNGNNSNTTIIRALDIYGDLASAVPGGLKDGSALRIVLEQYDAASIKEHVLRTRHLLVDGGNPPTVVSLVEQPITIAIDAAATAKEHDQEETDHGKNVNKKNETAAATESSKEGRTGEDVVDQKETQEEQEQEETPPTLPPLPKLPTIDITDAKVDACNLADYFYLACGEDPKQYRTIGNVDVSVSKSTSFTPTTATAASTTPSSSSNSAPPSPSNGSKSKKKKKSSTTTTTTTPTKESNGNNIDSSSSNCKLFATMPECIQQQVIRYNQLEEDVFIACDLRYSGFHPPPPQRRLVGDLAYLEFTPPPPPPPPLSPLSSPLSNDIKQQQQHQQQEQQESTIYITATTTGFYVNKSHFQTNNNGRRIAIFDPTPKKKHVVVKNYNSKNNNNTSSNIINNKACFAHSLLDCLLQASPSLQTAWHRALIAAKERAEILSLAANPQQLAIISTTGGANSANGANSAGGVGWASGAGTFLSLFRMAIRADFPGFATPARAAAAFANVDASLGTPSWLVALPRCKNFTAFSNSNDDDSDDDDLVSSLWNRNAYYNYNPARTEEEFSQTFGVDIRNGGLRDWNEELQLAREMPTNTFLERLERARAIHKAIQEFGEAALVACQAICTNQNQIIPMNPNEGTRTQVYLHNNIFISRAIDCGPETFRMVKGDGAAKKSASREIQCIKTFHRMEHAEFHTLATVLVDYLGTRFICQSILPGILMGEKSHSVLLGSVDTDLPLVSDDKFHALVEEKIGKPLNLSSRRIYTSPLTPERREECRKLKKVPPLPAGMSLAAITAMEKKDNEKKKKEPEDPNATIMTCAPVEAKGIKGSDQRCYLLDFGRMTPRDANWVALTSGGTGKWDTTANAAADASADDDNINNNGNNTNIPPTLDDEEWTMHVLRPELINRWIRHKVTERLTKKRNEMEAAQKEKDEKTKKENGSGDDDDKADTEKAEDAEKKEDPHVQLTEEEQESVTQDLKLNVNVFIPDLRVVDEEERAADEGKAREAASFLWDEILPRITRAIKEGTVTQIPLDGKALTEFLHRHGVNCRYLGRLAALARAEEATDAKITNDLNQNRPTTFFEQKTMPLCWLDLLECEMVARAAKHVLDRYLTENSGVAACRPLQTIATLLSALVSEREETAAQTEARMNQRSDGPDEEDFQELTMYDVGGDGDAVPPPTRSRTEIWKDIEREVGRRFRYTLSLYNTGNAKSGRALHIPLLRRVCMRTGVRLVAKNYDVGGRSYTGGSTHGGRLAESYPISPLDIVDVVPLMKHSAAYHEGFLPCSLRPTIVTPPLQVSLVDAKVAMERAHIQLNARSLQRALELAQEAASLYQRVTENGAHPGVVECMELMANIFLEAGDPLLAAANGAKTLGLAIQSGGFDGHSAFNIHMTLFHMCLASRELDRCVCHLRAAIYLLEIMGGPRHFELAGIYHKLGQVYSHPEYKGDYNALALQFFRIFQGYSSCDRVMEGFSTKSFAKNLADAGEYKEAVEVEKRAYQILARFLGKDHEWVKDCDRSLQEYTKLAVQHGSRVVESKKMQEEAEKADAVAAVLAAAEQDDEKKKKKKKKKSKK